MANPSEANAPQSSDSAQPLEKIGGEQGAPEHPPQEAADDAPEIEPAEGRRFEPTVRNETAADGVDAQGPAGETRGTEAEDVRGPDGDAAEDRR